MQFIARLSRHVRELEPGIFAAVMATGIVSVDVGQHGMPSLAQALLLLNVALYLALLAMFIWRLIAFREAFFDDLVSPTRGAGFLTLTAGTCVLGTQFVEVVDLPSLAWVLLAWGALLWLLLTYLFLVATITARIKPKFTRSIHGGWLVAVVATEAVSCLLTLLAGDSTVLHFVAICLFLLGASLYAVIITLVVYRLVFFPLRARDFTPPYWINMGALAISTLAGSLIVVNLPAAGALQSLLPFVKGLTVLFWATASWWIPLLVALDLWRHVWRHVRLRYETDDWDIVFPIGMYTVGTWELSRALGLDFLRTIAEVGVWVNLAIWGVVAAAAVRSGLSDREPGESHTSSH